MVASLRLSGVQLLANLETANVTFAIPNSDPNHYFCHFNEG